MLRLLVISIFPRFCEVLLSLEALLGYGRNKIADQQQATLFLIDVLPAGWSSVVSEVLEQQSYPLSCVSVSSRAVAFIMVITNAVAGKSP